MPGDLDPIGDEDEMGFVLLLLVDETSSSLFSLLALLLLCGILKLLPLNDVPKPRLSAKLAAAAGSGGVFGLAADNAAAAESFDRCLATVFVVVAVLVVAADFDVDCSLSVLLLLVVD